MVREGKDYAHQIELPIGDVVSLIVAVFNVKPYLASCIDSLSAQSHTEIEIILVDDGSTDGSGEVCDEYANLDARIRVIHQENRGLSAARNAGTKVATGDWIAYVDSDDVVDERYVLAMLECARSTSSQVVSCRFKTFCDDVPKQQRNDTRSPIVLPGVNAACEVLSEKHASTSAWGKLATASLWKALAFPQGRRFEDLPVTWKLFESAEQAALLQQELYFYRKRSNSISDEAAATPKSVLDYAISISQMLDETGTSEHAAKLEKAAAFRACLESCRLYGMAFASKGDDEAFGLARSFAQKCIGDNVANALSNDLAPYQQKARIAMMATAPKASLTLFNFARKLAVKKRRSIKDDCAWQDDGRGFLRGCKRIICLADTPFQIMSLICAFSDSNSRNFDVCDVIVDPRFEGAEAACNRLRETGIFTNVYCGKARYPEHDNKTTQTIIVDALQRQRYVAKRLFGAYPEIAGNDYDCMLTSYPTLKAYDAKRTVAVNGITLFFDDGAGSHNGNVFKPFCIQDDVIDYNHGSEIRTKKEAAKVIARTVSGNLFKLDVRGMLLFNPTSDDSRRYSNVYVERISADSCRDDIRFVLAPNIMTAPEEAPQVVFLSLPDGVNKEFYETESELISRLIDEFGSDVAFRFHPRRSTEEYKGLNVKQFENGNLWEALITDGLITDATILVGFDSTAQVTPKQLTNIEPTVILLHQLIRLSETEYQAAKGVEKTLRKLYTNETRILVPESLEETLSCIAKAKCNYELKARGEGGL